MKIVISAPGKIHLLGEHVVVYGKPALIAAIDRRLYATIKVKSQKSKVKSNLQDKLISKAIEVFKKSYKIDNLPSIEISVSSQIPVGSGLGSSAALAVSIIGALMKGVLNIWNPIKINELAFEVEKLQHGNPSGGDNTTITFGGLIWYRREFDFLQSIWSLPAVNYKIPSFVLIDSGKPEESTGEMVRSVGEFGKKNKIKFAEILTSQELYTKNLLLALKNGDKKEIIRSIRDGERNLEKLKVVGEKAKRIIMRVEKLGGAAKVSGGGGLLQGSGYLLCYHEDFTKLCEIEKEFRLTLSKVKLAEEGVRIEQWQK